MKKKIRNEVRFDLSIVEIETSTFQIKIKKIKVIMGSHDMPRSNAFAFHNTFKSKLPAKMKSACENWTAE
jgi:hypothetical protein